MGARKPAPTPVLIVDNTFGIVGLRRSGGRKTMPGRMLVVSALAGPSHIPDTLIPSEIHLMEPRVRSPFQYQCIQEVVDLLLERMEP